jgi:hypothetical protein
MPSSVVADMEYNEAARTLRITYVSGMVYDYLKVPLSVYKEMKAASSKGTYLNYQIKGKYKFRKVSAKAT